MKFLNKFRDQVFAKIHNNNLIYNACWEDPRIDRELLHFNESSRIVMITSAGCNALDYLLDNPAVIHCIDLNPRQNAVLELKRALFRKGSYEQLWAFFGRGYEPNAKEIYHQLLRDELPKYARDYWDQHLRFFMGSPQRNSFYFYGTSGYFAWLFHKYLKMRGSTYQALKNLFDAQTLEEQEQAYEKVEPAILNYFIKWLMNRHVTMSLLGVPRPQRRLIREGHPGGLGGFLADKLRHVFTKLPTHDNYFWQVYAFGHYTESNCPNYLRRENFETLQERVENLRIHTTSISDFLKNNKGPYSHYILLDHQDWLAAHMPQALQEEWEQIDQNSIPGTQFMLRSAALNVDFFPQFVREKFAIQQEELMDYHLRDRVGTYGSMYVGTYR